MAYYSSRLTHKGTSHISPNLYLMHTCTTIQVVKVAQQLMCLLNHNHVQAPTRLSCKPPQDPLVQSCYMLTCSTLQSHPYAVSCSFSRLVRR